jgi:chromosomal replication initiator protein
MVVYSQTDVSVDLIKEKTRKSEIVIVRFIMMYLMKKYTIMSLKSIGEYFSGRDHSTVINGLDVVAKWFDQPKMYSSEIKLLMQIESEVKP